MFLKKLLSALTALTFALTFCVFPDRQAAYAASGEYFTAAKASEINVSAVSAVLIEKETRRVLYARNENTPMGMASTTKIMTSLVVAERASPDDEVIVPPEAVGIEGSSVYLKAGDIFTVRELLYALLLESGNDAAEALAIHVAGTSEGFAALMNEKALEMGLADAHFTNPSGLTSDGHCISALSLAYLTSELLDNELLAEIVSTKSIKVGNRYYVNHNKLLSTCDGCIGVKTGYTKASGRCLVSAATRDGMTLIAVTLNDVSCSADHRYMYDKAFSEFSMETLPPQTVTLTLVGSREGFASASTKPVRICVKNGEEISVTIKKPYFVYAPASSGAFAAEAVICADGVPVCETAFVFDRDYDYYCLTLFERINRFIRNINGA